MGNKRKQMTLGTKAALFYGAYVIGGVLVGGFTFTRLSEPAGMSAIFLWFLAFGLAQFILLRCPHCKRLAIKTPRGAYVPWTGTRCRYCRKEY